MTNTVRDDPVRSRFEIFVDGAPAGSMQYHLFEDRAALLHTEIAPAFGGRGLGTELIGATLDEARRRGWQVEPFCPFVRGYLAKHPDDVDLVPVGERRRFGLS